MEYREFAQLLLQRDGFLILSHIRPDGDTLGSGSALCSALRRMGKTAYVICNPELTERYAPYVEPFSAPEGFAPSCVVAVDIAAPNLFPKNFSGAVD
ncbi:MAG: phosphoesterase RecJ domain-containing protein, partial [Clostridiales bacterium]|nr:phosphoesterase RecJ domain-containing protein [Clostridiales bacterium]